MTSVADALTYGYPSFDRPVPASGYCWWYIDALSEDRQHMLTIIAFVGSVFSPYYKWARCNGDADPMEHCSINVVLYGRKHNRWCMTERHGSDISRTANRFVVGPSQLNFVRHDDRSGVLTIDIDEKNVPLPRSVRGRISVDVTLQKNKLFALDASASHLWWPAGPNSSISVALEQPDLQWHGDAYVDMNWGDRPLEDDIHYWCWSRMRTKHGTYLYYDLYSRDSPNPKQFGADRYQQHDGGIPVVSPDISYALRVDADGQVKSVSAEPLRKSQPTRWWRMPRLLRAGTDDTHSIQTLEDTPFYSRSAVCALIDGVPASGMHESVSLKRFSHPLVQAMLCCRMPRWRAGTARR